MIAHTPGSWYWDFDRDGLASLRSDAGDGEPIMIDIGLCPGVEDRALIAAAPDLLEALENLENDAGQIPDDAWKIVKDAIARAKGEQP